MSLGDHIERWMRAFPELFGEPESLSEDERVYCEEWLFRNSLAHDRRITFVAIWLTLVGVGCGAFVFAGTYRWMFCVSHATATLIAAVAYRLADVAFTPRLLHLSMLVVCVGAVALGARQALTEEPDQLIPALLTLLGLALGFLRLAPLAGWRYLAGAALLSVVITVLALRGTVVLFPMLGVMSVTLAVAVGHEAARMRHLRREAVLEFRARAAVLAAERSRQAHELALASEIQDSFSPAGEGVRSGPWTAAWLSEKRETLGGDWAAIARRPQGGLIAVVADVTGKGVPAALVVHAVQSLWAGALDGDEAAGAFDARAWINRVNDTLYRLGRRRPQTLTLGLAEIDADKIVYWSAAHLPLFLVGDAGEVKALTARGGMIGIGPELALEPSTWIVPQGPRWRAVLATDGVFARGTRTKHAEILQLVEKLEREGQGALTGLSGEDDRTVVWASKVA